MANANVKKILVADDSQTVLQILRLALAKNRYVVITADNGLDAYRLFKEEVFDLVLTDLNMPGLDGLELIRKIRKELDNQVTPIIMLTTESQEAMKTAGREAGANGWIVKPFKAEQLLNLVAKILN